MLTGFGSLSLLCHPERSWFFARTLACHAERSSLLRYPVVVSGAGVPLPCHPERSWFFAREEPAKSKDPCTARSPLQYQGILTVLMDERLPCRET
jgi:hypothetical protein